MNSIDNLREYALTAASVNATTRAVLAGYVDEIEREVKELRDRDYRNGMEDGEMAAERDGWVRKNKEHVISHATVEVTPHIDWSRMADELDEFVEIVRGMAGDAE